MVSGMPGRSLRNRRLEVRIHWGVLSLTSEPGQPRKFALCHFLAGQEKTQKNPVFEHHFRAPPPNTTLARVSTPRPQTPNSIPTTPKLSNARATQGPQVTMPVAPAPPNATDVRTAPSACTNASK